MRSQAQIAIYYNKTEFAKAAEAIYTNLKLEFDIKAVYTAKADTKLYEQNEAEYYFPYSLYKNYSIDQIEQMLKDFYEEYLNKQIVDDLTAFCEWGDQILARLEDKENLLFAFDDSLFRLKNKLLELVMAELSDEAKERWQKRLTIVAKEEKDREATFELFNKAIKNIK